MPTASSKWAVPVGQLRSTIRLRVNVPRGDMTLIHKASCSAAVRAL